MSIKQTEARQIALNHVMSSQLAAGIELTLLDDQTETVDRGWVYFYESTKFIRTGDFLDAALGNCPIFVALDGSLTLLPTYKTWQEGLKDLE